MDSLDALVVVFGEAGGGDGICGRDVSLRFCERGELELTLEVEGVLHLASGVLLRHEKAVEVPEARLDEPVRRHLSESGPSKRQLECRSG